MVTTLTLISCIDKIRLEESKIDYEFISSQNHSLCSSFAGSHTREESDIKELNTRRSLAFGL